MVTVKQYGAQGTGKTDDLIAVQKAIDAEKELFFPRGVYIVSDTVRVPSDRKLVFEAGATLTLQANTPRKRGDFLLTNRDEQTGNENITIIGATFDGNNGHPLHRRPKDIFQTDGYSGVLINFCSVKNLVLRDVTLQDPVAYYTRFCRIDGFEIKNIVLKSKRIKPNQDGIHFAGEVRNGVVKNVRVETFGQTNDDLLALNADDFPGRIEEFDTVCGDIENVLFEDIYAESCHDAVRLLSFRSAIRNVTFKNLNVGFRQRAVDCNAARGCRAELFKDEDYPEGVGRVENVRFVDCTFWHALDYPLWWSGSIGSFPHPFIQWGSLADNVEFDGCRFVPAPKQKGGFLQNALNAIRRKLYNKALFPQFFIHKVSGSVVTVDGEAKKVGRGEELKISSFTSLRIDSEKK